MLVSECCISVTLSHDLLFVSWPWRAVASSCPWVPSHSHPNPPWTLGRTSGGCTPGVISLTPWFSPYPVSTPPVLMLPPTERGSGKYPYTPTHSGIPSEVGHRSGVVLCLTFQPCVLCILFKLYLWNVSFMFDKESCKMSVHKILPVDFPTTVHVCFLWEMDLEKDKHKNWIAYDIFKTVAKLLFRWCMCANFCYMYLWCQVFSTRKEK